LSSFEERFVVALFERSSTDDEFVESDTDGPDVAQPLVVEVRLSALRREILYCSPAECGEESIGRASIPLLSEPEIDENRSIVRGE
jgi:hypothetical protein